MENIKKVNEFVTLYSEGNIAYMVLHNGVYNKIRHPEFIKQSELEEYILEVKPKALVIKGEKRNFSSGADIDNIMGMDEIGTAFKAELNRGKELLTYIESLGCITVAQISGACYGGGLEIALSCQFRIAATSAMFAFPESTLGLLPGMGGTVRLQRLIGKGKAIKMTVSGQSYTAEEALNMGLVDALCEKKELSAEVTSFINSICGEKKSEHIDDIITTINEQSYLYETEIFTQYVLKTRK